VYFAYVDETGIDGVSPLMVMVGVVVNDERLNRTQGDFAAIFENLGELVIGTLKELKSSDMLAGSGAWRKVDGQKRRNVITNLCEWLCTRKHDLALAAIEHQAHAASAPGTPVLNDVWLAGASHIALQLQRAHQTKAGNKGRTVLVFDDNKRGLSDIADLVYDPPAWTDDYYDRQKKAPALDRLVDTPFAVKSHHVGLVQVADIFAAIFRRHSELADYALKEKYACEQAHVAEWVEQLTPRLLGKQHRWAARTNSDCSAWYSAIAPTTLKAL